MHSDSSSLLGKVLVFPFPFSRRIDYALILGGPRDYYFDGLGSSKDLTHFKIVFHMPLFATSPSLGSFAVSSALQARCPYSYVSSGVFAYDLKSPGRVGTQTYPVSGYLFYDTV